MITYCSKCDNVHPDSKKSNQKYWTCIMFANLGVTDFVQEGVILEEPYMYCKNINGGKCPCYKPKKEEN